MRGGGKGTDVHGGSENQIWFYVGIAQVPFWDRIAPQLDSRAYIHSHSHPTAYTAILSLTFSQSQQRARLERVSQLYTPTHAPPSIHTVRHCSDPPHASTNRSLQISTTHPVPPLPHTPPSPILHHSSLTHQCCRYLISPPAYFDVAGEQRPLQDFNAHGSNFSKVSSPLIVVLKMSVEMNFENIQ